MSTLPSNSPMIVQPPATTCLPEDQDLEIDYDALVTEDNKPVERILIEKLYRLLTHVLYASWQGPGDGRAFLVLANVGWFYQDKTPAIVPDCLLSLGVACPDDLHVKQGHSYYQWRMGKPPDVVIEAVSDRTGGEEDYKKSLYARQGVAYYAIFDPQHLLSEDTLQTYELAGGEYRRIEPGPWPKIGLGLRLWSGKFEGHEDLWLRWCDAEGAIVPTAEERANQAEQRADQAEDLNKQKDERILQLEAELQRLRNERSTGRS